MYENDIPTWEVDVERTLVFDPKSSRQVAWLRGQIILPVGSKIELYDEDLNAHGDAIVTGIRMLAGAGNTPPQLCLDCDVEERWWDAHPYK